MTDHLAAERVQMRVKMAADATVPVHERGGVNQMTPPCILIEDPYISFDQNRQGIVEWPIAIIWSRSAPAHVSTTLERELQVVLRSLAGMSGFALRDAVSASVDINNIECPAYRITILGVLPNC